MNRRTVRVRDDNGRTRASWAPAEYGLTKSEWAGLSMLDGRTGNKRGRPKLPDDELSEEGARSRERRLLIGGTSGPDCWARERRERDEAAARASGQIPRRGDGPSLGHAPDGLRALWSWALTQSADRGEPERLHYPQGGETVELFFSEQRGELNPSRDDVIGGLPFTKRFERFLDKGTPNPIFRAHARMYTSPPSLEYRILWAILYGRHDDPDTLYAILGRPKTFYPAALGALRALYGIAQSRMAA